MEFDADGGPEKSDLIQLFREGFKPSVRAQMEQRGRKVNSWDKLVQKTIDVNAKASLQHPLSSMRWIRGNRPAHTAVAKS